MQPPQKILVVAPAWVGDLIMSQALFKLIKQQNPQAVIHVLAAKHLHPLLQLMPEVTQALPLPFLHGELNLLRRWRLGKSLRSENYTEAIVLPNSFKSALVPFFAKIPKRTGARGEWRIGVLNNLKVLPPKLYPMMVQRFLALGVDSKVQLPKILPRPQLTVDSNLINQVLEKFALKKPLNPLLALCPGAEFGPAKRWPAAYFAAIAKAKKQIGWDIWIFGGDKDKDIAAAIEQLSANSCIDFCGKTNLGEVAALLSLATVVVTNDTGLMHVAAALKRRIIAIYGSSSPLFTPPLADEVKILSLNLPCSPCFKRECPLGHMQCLNELKPDMVLPLL